MSERVLLVLYRSERNQSTYCEYAGGKDEADREFDLMAKEDDSLEEVARIWINKTAEVVFYQV